MNNYSITTFKGTEFNPFGKELDIEVIARGLSRTGRFSGQGNEFYSVAQHSVLLSQIVITKGFSNITSLVALLHDSPDFLLGDISTPIRKHLKLIMYNGLYDNILNNFLSVFLAPYNNFIKHFIQFDIFDKRLALTEAKALDINTSDWNDPRYTVSPYPIEIIPTWTHKHAEKRFMYRFKGLMNKINTKKGKIK